VVFKTDTGGGMHCCWAYNIISLAPKPQHLFDIDQQGLVQFEKDKHDKLIIWKRTAGPYGFTSMAATPFAEKVLQVREGKLTDITPEYCGELSTEKNEEFRFWQEKLTATNLKRLQESQAPGGEDTEEVVSALLSKALQHVFCRQFDEALKDLDLWPEASRAKMKKEFGISIKNDYPEFAARLEADK
jgi:hypothetical protein